MNAINESNQTTPPETVLGLRNSLLDLAYPVYLVSRSGNIVSTSEQPSEHDTDTKVLAYAPPLPIERLGSELFKKKYGVKYSYTAGGMANAIASTKMVIALGNAGFLGSFGAAGINGDQLDAAIHTIQSALPDGPYAFNLLYTPNEDALEKHTVEKYLGYGIPVVEAGAYIDMTPSLIQYRLSGLSAGSNGQVQIANRIIAKVSRKEVAEKFLKPAPETLLGDLVAARQITPEQAELARHIPVADDISVEADSGGHTDNRPLVTLLPSIISLRDEIQAKYKFSNEVQIGAAGGISTPEAALAAFLMGASYIVTGTINQACVESGTSTYVKTLLSQAGMTDVAMAPSADMFELGARVQVLKKGTLYPMRAQKLFELYTRYDSLEQIPLAEQDKLARQIFQRQIDEIWRDVVTFFEKRNPTLLDRAKQNPKQKMALIFRWYLGLSSRWAISNEKGREMDYQVWCGPSIGSFNDWTRNTYLEKPENRAVVDLARQILTGAAFQYRLQTLRMQWLNLPTEEYRYKPSFPLTGL